MRSITIAIDFDGTVVEHRYPHIGKDNGNCVEILKRWIKEYNVKLLLSTMRYGDGLKEAIRWFEDRGIPLYGIQKDPRQEEWTDTPKCDAMFCIDDRNVGTPMVRDSSNLREMVDWDKIVEIFEPTLKAINVL